MVNAFPYHTRNNNTLIFFFCIFVIICFWFDWCAFDLHSYFSYSDFPAILLPSTFLRPKLLTMFLKALKASTQLAHELLFNDVRSFPIFLIFFLWIMLKPIVAFWQRSEYMYPSVLRKLTFFCRIATELVKTYKRKAFKIKTMTMTMTLILKIYFNSRYSSPLSN